MRSFLLTISVFILTACDRPGPPQQTSLPVAPPAQAKTEAPSPALILTAFQKDISVCESLVKILKADRTFIDSFSPEENRRSKTLADFLRQSPYVSTPEFQYVLLNPRYFEIDISFHGAPWAVAWVQDEGIFCSPTLERLNEIEALQESEQGWDVRRFFLDKALQNLEQPGDEESGGEVTYEYFKSMVLETSTRYSGMQRPKFLAWVKSAIDVVDRSRGKIEDGSAGLSALDQNRILDERVMFLRNLEKKV